ncbi:O-antigen ligase family protein [Ottowia beijingensis]|uniref:O-antigen ligase family protein n=2 Tax=Ottowia beijingensis TaxID=1207057 RepID=A0A853IYB7_9BURK|nr:O-antigen ligase family protein [Ottowia beijingensis]
MLERLRTGESTCGSRLILWRNVLHLIGLKPWTGWGWGELDYAHYITLYEGARFCHILDNAHNLPLHLAVELGVPVALAVCGLVAWLVWRGRPWAEQHPRASWPGACWR